MLYINIFYINGERSLNWCGGHWNGRDKADIYWHCSSSQPPNFLNGWWHQRGGSADTHRCPLGRSVTAHQNLIG